MNDLQTKLAGRRVIASVSGGKDSAALSLFLTEQGIDHDRVFMDTGWEAAETYAYLRGDLTRALGPLTEIGADKKMVELTIHKGMFPSKQRRWCTTELKVKPMQRFIRARMDAGDDVVNAVGIRHAESEARANLPEWEWSDGFDCETWRPLIMWSEQDVIDIHARHGLRPNPLYLKGAERVGCWPCIYARKSEIRLIADVDPAKIAQLRALEDAVTEKARTIVEARGETLTHQRTWFQAPMEREGTWPIDRVVEWSRTSHGGKQFEMFADSGRDAGCMRWGLCETGPSESVSPLPADARSIAPDSTSAGDPASAGLAVSGRASGGEGLS